MDYSAWNGETLLGYEFDGSVFEVDEEAAVDDVEEFVFVIVFVPVKFALHDAEPDDAVIHLAEGLVVPLVLAGFDERFEIDELERIEFCIQIDGVRSLTGHASLPWLQRWVILYLVRQTRVARSEARDVATRDKSALTLDSQTPTKIPRRERRSRGYPNKTNGEVDAGKGGGASRRCRRRAP